MTTHSNWVAGLALIAGLFIGCSSGPTGPARGTAEWYWQSALTAYGEGDLAAALEELKYAADGEGEFASRAAVLTGVLTAALARANVQVADSLRTGIEENEDLTEMVRTPLQQAERNARQNIISFVEELGKFKTALGTGEVSLAFPFPPGNRNESAAMNSLEMGEMISPLQLADGIVELTQRGIAKTVAMSAGMGDDMAGAQAKLDAGPVTVPGDQFQLIVAGFLVDMSGSFAQKKMNDPKIREVVIQRAEEWIAAGLESENADIKKRAEDLQFDIENEKRDRRGEKPLKRS